MSADLEDSSPGSTVLHIRWKHTQHVFYVAANFRHGSNASAQGSLLGIARSVAHMAAGHIISFASGCLWQLKHRLPTMKASVYTYEHICVQSYVCMYVYMFSLHAERPYQDGTACSSITSVHNEIINPWVACVLCRPSSHGLRVLWRQARMEPPSLLS